MAGRKNKKTPGIGEPPHIIAGLKALADSGAQYLIVGGVASNLHGLVRATKDIDVLIPKDLENTKKLLRGLESLAWGLSREIDAERVINKPFTIIGDQPRVDLLLRAGKLTFEAAIKNAQKRVVDGVRLAYVSLDDLILSKATGRPRDDIEIQELKRLKKIK
ncbi:MAG: nucleotidyltransferase [Deltaproteobacteria bacterium]|nr:nucleotidyltransferase [Deltaproteobacteria bacterium]